MDEAGIFDSFIAHNKCLSKKRVAIYGTGKYAHRFANEQNTISVVCYLDKEKTGEFCSKPIMSLEHAFRGGVDTVIIAASAYNEIIIYDRIKDICRKNGVDIYGVHYGELTKYVGDKYEGYAASAIVVGKKYDEVIIDWENTILYDVFLSKQQFFRLLEAKALSEGGCFPNLALVRARAETMLNSKGIRFDLDDVYHEMESITQMPMAAIENIKALEKKLLLTVWKQNRGFLAILKDVKSAKGKLIIDNKTCYSDELVFRLIGGLCDNPCGTMEALADRHREEIFNQYKRKRIESNRKLYISYTPTADELLWRVNDTDVWTLNNDNRSRAESDIVSFLKNSYYINTQNILSLAYKDVAYHTEQSTGLYVDNIYDFAYSYMAPLISAYVIWLIKQFEGNAYDAVLFAARDGFLIKELYDYAVDSLQDKDLPQSIYFYTSRKASVKAGMIDDGDVKKVCEYLNKDYRDLPTFLYGNEADAIPPDSRDDVLYLSKCARENYYAYLDNINIDYRNGRYAFCDLISSGTSQFFLQKLFSNPLEGYYLAYYISKLGVVPVRSLYPSTSAEQIFPDAIRNILESILTSSEPSVTGFDRLGHPVFTDNKQSSDKLEYIALGQKAVRDFYHAYWEKLYCSDGGELEYMMLVAWIEQLRQYVQVDESIFSSVCLTEDMFKKEISLSFAGE